jgi:tetratricopeptide (TPR) repeat protein
MGQILKFPVEAARLGYKRVRKRARSENPDQLQLSFPTSAARILSLAPPLSSFEQALMLDERGDSHAADLYARAIENQECVADAYCNLGIIESQKGNTTKAFDCFTTTLKHDPRHSEAHYNLANLYFELNDFRLAQVHYEMAAEVDTAFANAYYNLALVQSIHNDFAAAIQSLTKYQQLSSEAEARNADELLHSFKKSLATKNTRVTGN